MRNKNLKIEDYLAVDNTSKTGLRWIKGRGRKIKSGDEAFTRIDSMGYYGGAFNYTDYTAHRVIMYLTYSEWSTRKKHVDHIDGNRLNNNIDNLHFVPPTSNQKNDNRKMQSNNTSGIKGLSLVTTKGSPYWIATHYFNRKQVQKTSKDKQVCIDWLTESRKNDSQYINFK
tara:strand:- start:27 stop:539 length:513 start_codon:yes stop_codon:yes gene_type:complete